MIACTGRIHGKPVIASIYENSRYANVLEVHIGKGWSSKEVPAGFRHEGQMSATTKVAGDRVRIASSARSVGRPQYVHEALDDMDKHIVSDGTHRRLRTDLTIGWRHQTRPLTCTNAFIYRLTVTTSPRS